MNLYHYTDVDAIKSILKNEKLWMTDVRFLNDSQEMREGFKILIDYLSHRVVVAPNHHECFSQAVKYIRDVLGRSDDYGLGKRPVYVTSFSLAGDLLSQWRAYGGYAIEFDSESIPHQISKCIYNDDEKLTDSAHIALDCALAIAESMKKNDGELDVIAYDALSELIGLSATLKHRSFSEEQEYRIISGHDVDPSVEDDLEVCYRSRGNMLIPYVEISVPLDSIKSIVVGPMRNQDLAYASMKSYVEKIDRAAFSEKSFYISSISVVKSSIPFRAEY